MGILDQWDWQTNQDAAVLMPCLDKLLVFIAHLLDSIEVFVSDNLSDIFHFSKCSTTFYEYSIF